MTSILEDLGSDCWEREPGQRPHRCTGSALKIAISLMEVTAKNRCGRVMLFTAGPPTVGPGMVVSLDSSETIRAHSDVQKGNVPHYHKACRYYDALGNRAAAAGHAVDVFAAAMDQTGVAEMRTLVQKTGGYLVLDDDFSGESAGPVFKKSFRRVFARDGTEQNGLVMCFKSRMSVKTSPEIKIYGGIGIGYSLERKSNSVSEHDDIGVGGTCAWSLGAVDPNTTVGIYFDIVTQDPKNVKDQCYIQIVTQYETANGATVLRVTTVSKTFADVQSQQGFEHVKMGFDQEAATVLIARMAVFKTRRDHPMDILRWLDRQLIRLVQKFGEYTKDVPDSFTLPDAFAFFPQFIFHLRRTNLLQVFNSSPDETVFWRLVMLRENISNTLVMIQPTLTAYSLNEEFACQPVLLDVSSVKPDRILLLDDFFHVVLFYGDTVYQWKQNKLYEQEAYAYLKDFFDGPANDAKSLTESRMPTPINVICHQDGSQSRFLMAKLNPSATQNNTQVGQGVGKPVFTDDVSFKVFLEHLKKLAVQQ